MTKRMIAMLAAVILVIGGILGFKYMMAIGAKQYLSHMPQPPQTVSTTLAGEQMWQQEVDAVGTVRAVNGADLSSELSGIVESIDFSSGADVKKGDILVQLRDEDDTAKLQALQAAASLAATTLTRDRKQLAVQAISQATFDKDQATLDSDNAQVSQQQAIIDKKTIRAPFAGHLGIRQVDIGQYVAAGTPLVTLQQLNPIYVDFNVPEQALAQLSVGQKIAARCDAAPNAVFDGTISSINSKIDEATRNVQVRASFKNPDEKLLPGMFARVSITTGAPQELITLPATAITYNPYGDTVFLAEKGKDGKLAARQTFVTVGQTRGDQVSVLSGVKKGDEVVTSGQLKLHNGTPLTVNNKVQPADISNPKPVDE
ncbi:MAG: efflux RND transporter periplasmic adaptor subunit [Alphaproteobacteria bacterium]|nr:efflux RND transporter periplasmic adaptor subunit [Alphaproteobacteria bacterium]